MGGDSELSRAFPKAADPDAWGRGYKLGGSGLNVIENTFLPHSDVIIFSDTDHSKTEDIYEDMFPDSMLSSMSQNGFNNIVIEMPMDAQGLVNDLAQGIIDGPEFVNAMLDMGYGNSHLSPQDNAKQLTDIADVIERGAQQNPPIRVVCAQMPFTPEEESNLEGIIQRSGTYDQVHNAVNELAEQVGLSQENIELLVRNAELFIDANMFTQNRNGLDFSEELGPLIQSLKQIVPAEMVDEFVEKIEQAKDLALGARGEYIETLLEYRNDSDSRLGELITGLGGKSVVVHGSGHGADSNNDLDEILQNEGLKTGRINIIYDRGASQRLPHKPDPSEINYHPDRDGLHIKDYDGDQRIEGLPVTIQHNDNMFQP
ncbi:MAG: hypothetical protein AB8B83_01740 [Bdellovibrionales bacterium]